MESPTTNPSDRSSGFSRIKPDGSSSALWLSRLMAGDRQARTPDAAHPQQVVVTGVRARHADGRYRY